MASQSTPTMSSPPPSPSDQSRPPSVDMRPLYVDLDGTLVQTDTLHESILLLLRQQPWMLWWLLVWVWGGKAFFKRRLAERVSPDPAHWPYHPEFLPWLTAQHSQGRPLVLATAADIRIAQAVADHLGLFCAVLATNQTPQDRDHRVNLSREGKRQAIEAHARQQGWSAYDYAGNSRDDEPVWAGARAAVAVNAPAAVIQRLRRAHPDALQFDAARPSACDWTKALRLSQWAKNALLFVPLLAAHLTSLDAWLAVCLGFVAFGLCASATYLVNDLLDLPNDRRHPHKRHRPLAAGRMPVSSAVLAAVVLLPLAFGLASWVSPGFLGMLVIYTLVTLAYSLYLKRIALLDVLVLSGLFTLRILAGAVAAGVTVSNWLLAISLFLFFGLALVKRCAELEEVLIDAESDQARGRGYHQNDLPALRAMGIASGFSTVLVLALYIDSHNGRDLYPQPEWLWGMVPLLLWWLMRLWLKTGRRQLHGEDPLQFALHDRFSWGVLLAFMVLGMLASWGGG